MNTPSLMPPIAIGVPSCRRTTRPATASMPINHGTPWSTPQLTGGLSLYTNLCKKSANDLAAMKKEEIQKLANSMGRKAEAVSVRLQNQTAIRKDLMAFNPGLNLPTLEHCGYPAARNMGSGVAVRMIEIMIASGEVPANIIIPPHFLPHKVVVQIIAVRLGEEGIRQRMLDMNNDIRTIENDPTLTATMKEQLILVRLGQGTFRALALLLNMGCAVLGADVAPVLLTAGHIIPWRHANDQQRLDPYNCLLLSPDLARLFDLDLIGFDPDTKAMVVSPHLPGGFNHKLLHHVPHHLRSDYVVHPEQAVYLKAQLLRVMA